MKIQILGTGCAKCRKLAASAAAAAAALDLDHKIEKITDIGRITEFGVMLTPALAVDGTVLVTGRVPSVDELKKILRQAGKP
jgi:small redox-active disulfide protein 2